MPYSLWSAFASLWSRRLDTYSLLDYSSPRMKTPSPSFVLKRFFPQIRFAFLGKFAPILGYFLEPRELRTLFWPKATTLCAVCASGCQGRAENFSQKMFLRTKSQVNSKKRMSHVLFFEFKHDFVPKRRLLVTN